MRIVPIVILIALISLIVSRQVEPLAPSADIPEFGTVREKLGGSAHVNLPPLPEYDAQAGCPFPGIAKGTELVLISAHGAQGVSSVTLGSQEVAVAAGHLAIEEGEAPLYIVVSTVEPVIWQVSGATHRVRHLVLASMASTRPPREHAPALAGATGLEADRVTVLGHRKCMNTFTRTPSPEATVAANVLRRYVGRMPDVMAADTHIWQASAPSGAVAHADPGLESWAAVPALVLQWLGAAMDMSMPLLKHEMEKFHPGGVVQIDPASVISRHSVLPYQVLPQEAGLIQLVEQGAVTVDNLGRITVLKPIRLPAGLTGAHARNFTLEDGVPLPVGDHGHSCIRSLAGMPLMKGALC